MISYGTGGLESRKRSMIPYGTGGLESRKINMIPYGMEGWNQNTACISATMASLTQLLPLH